MSQKGGGRIVFIARFRGAQCAAFGMLSSILRIRPARAWAIAEGDD